MKQIRTVLLALVAAILVGCGTSSTVPITGRKRTLMVSDEQVLSLSNQQYQQYMQTAKPSTNAANTAMVKRVGQNLANAVVAYLNANGLGSEVSQYKWEFNLVQDQQGNASFLYARFLRASSGMQQVAGTVFGLGAQGASAKYSRDHESEADHLGIIFAAMAGYDPDAAVSFWQRMSQATGGGSTSWLSTHPSDATRIKQIQGWLPEARKYYKARLGSGNSSNMKTIRISSKKSSKKKK